MSDIDLEQSCKDMVDYGMNLLKLAIISFRGGGLPNITIKTEMKGQKPIMTITYTPNTEITLRKEDLNKKFFVEWLIGKPEPQPTDALLRELGVESKDGLGSYIMGAKYFITYTNFSITGYGFDLTRKDFYAVYRGNKCFINNNSTLGTEYSDLRETRYQTAINDGEAPIALANLIFENIKKLFENPQTKELLKAQFSHSGLGRFIEALDKQFGEWGSDEQTKKGKI